MNEIGTTQERLDAELARLRAEAEVDKPKPVCPVCGSKNYRISEGCATCQDCGYSKCSL
jgi:transposase-like protein